VKVAVIMNIAAGSIGLARAEEQRAAVRDAFVAAGVEVDLRPAEGPKLTETARAAAASGVDAVVAAGGDGTVSAVASALAGGDVPMAVLPLGTLNHFARDLGMPKDLAEAARAIAEGRLARVDVGEVNGRVFVNNSSIGLYPLVVRAREAEQKRTGHGKWRAMAAAIWRVLRRFPLVSVLVKTEAGSIVTRTPFVFVGNNTYEFRPLAIGRRSALDGGHLCLYTFRCTSRWKLLWLAVRAIFQDAESVDNVEVAAVDALEVVLPRRRHVQVAADGEVITLRSPLRYAVRAGALPVIVPLAASGTNQAPAEAAPEAA
jgi:diacylglycerol kinase family enzyme